MNENGISEIVSLIIKLYLIVTCKVLENSSFEMARKYWEDLWNYNFYNTIKSICELNSLFDTRTQQIHFLYCIQRGASYIWRRSHFDN